MACNVCEFEGFYTDKTCDCCGEKICFCCNREVTCPTKTYTVCTKCYIAARVEAVSEISLSV